MAPLAAAEGITKHFGGIRALTNVTFAIEPNLIFGLIGPNGAGKTTLFNVLTGIYPADSGRIVFDGEDITGLQAHEIVARGIARTF